MIIPELDKSIGIEVYSTDLEGIGGKIRTNRSSFIVEEVLNNIEFIPDGYALYRLEKEGIDSEHAIEHIARKYGVTLKIFGLKDANARTIQYAISTRKGYNKEIIEKNYTLKFLGYVKPLTKSILLGNRFSIEISDYNQSKLTTLYIFKDYIDRIANFYGYQRFGTKRAITHIIGKEIVKRNFKNVIEIIRSNSNGDFERKVILEFEKYKDPIRALRKIPIRIRRLFIDAYKAYIFNKTLSRIIMNGYDLKPREGDLSFVFKDRVELEAFNNKYKAILAIPLVGYGFRAKSRFNDIINNTMQEEGIAHKDFYIKEMQEISSESSFRQALLLCKDFSYELPLRVRFILQQGGYATILLRELMKPRDPLMANF